MKYEKFTTFSVQVADAIAWVTFDDPPVNIQGLPMLADLDMLAQKLEGPIGQGRRVPVRTP